MFHCEPPPPSPDETRLRADLPWQFFHGRRVIAPRWLRYKLWRLHADLLRRFCAAEGIEFLPCPGEAFDEDGFLRADYYQDAMHVNVRYGALVLAQMSALT